MYEDITYDILINRMLNKVLATNNNIDTREGSLAWLGQAPAAAELQNVYLALDHILEETFADTASREHLILRAAERGLFPRSATMAILRLEIVPETIELDNSTRFTTGKINYQVTDRIDQGVYEITCETEGEIGNTYGDTIIPIDYIDGLESCQITGLLIPGEDEEETEAFRRRYFENLNAQAFGGNHTDYVEKIGSLPGVGGVKVYRAWNGDIRPSTLIPTEDIGQWITGASIPDSVRPWLTAVYDAGRSGKLTVGGTVKVVIIDSTFSSPSEVLVEQVQTSVDPIQNTGEGLGFAPIGHVVKVEGVTDEEVNISFTLTYQEEWDWEAVQPYVEKAINDYFKELSKEWADQKDALVIRISQVESRILGLAGVVDITDTMINGLASNYVLGLDRIPVLGAITVLG